MRGDTNFKASNSSGSSVYFLFRVLLYYTKRRYSVFQDAGEEYYSSDGDEGQFPGRGRGLRHPSGRGRPLCRHFKSPRGCLRGNSCPFLHPRGPPNGPPV